MARKNIKVSEQAFEKLRAEKPDGVTWDRFLIDAVDSGGFACEECGAAPSVEEIVTNRECPECCSSLKDSGISLAVAEAFGVTVDEWRGASATKEE